MTLSGSLPLAVAMCLLMSSCPAPAAHAQTPLLIPPVDAPLGARFEAPGSAYARGHRGIDYLVTRGAPVRAAAAGIVTFAGHVAGTLAVAVDHADGLSTTYSALGEVFVTRGSSIGQGHWLGTAERSHPGESQGLHFGVKLDGAYVDPQDYLGPLDLSRALHLAPLIGGDARSTSAAGSPGCRDVALLGPRPPAPNDNLAVVVAGIATQTQGGARPALYRDFASRWLGYPSESVYTFSYKGTDAPRAHEPYARRDTYADLHVAARRLRTLLVELARAHPHADVDLIAHSQGGIVARALLELLVESWDPSLPRIDHVVTFATPHLGAPLAALPRALRTGVVGRMWLRALSALSARGWLPLPASGGSVDQLAPGSSLLDALAREDVVYGARVLSLVMPHDVVVPADRALLAFETSRVVVPQGLSGHSSILGSRRAQALAYAFLRDAPASCTGLWDALGPLAGRAVGAAASGLAWLIGTAQRAIAPGLEALPRRRPRAGAMSSEAARRAAALA